MARSAMTPAMVVNTQALLASAQRLAELSSQLCLPSVRTRPELCDLSSCLCEWSDKLADLCTEDIALEIFPADSVQVHTATALLRDAVMQLVTNAVEAVSAESNKRIVVRTGVCTLQGEVLSHARPYHHARPHKYGYLEVEDTGAGIASEHIPRLFDPFFSTHLMGRGLGLFKVLEFVKSCQGLISIYPLGSRGTRARLLFPLAGAGKDLTEAESKNSGVFASI
jgi:signal transduction histidine kinase